MILEKEIREELLAFIDRMKSLVVGAVGHGGAPVMKVVTKLGRDGLECLYFCTSAESSFYRSCRETPKVSVCMFDDDVDTPYPSINERYYALTLQGQIESVDNRALKERFLSEHSGYLAQFYPNGGDDPSFHLVRFVIESGKYYKAEPEGSETIRF